MNVQVSQTEDAQIELTLLNSTGQVLQNIEDVQAVEGFNRYEIDVSTYPPGLYMIFISNREQRISRKVIVE
ncbi:MAG: T9SS type A sorting domain-containing protein [Phaeodactylibacter xiamenensis]|uniref:T9SS type A sorting domain-containing protein n=1 Tax=Phaeodactylibacter xiamenensis TaxID=1524460 RepID=UPI000907816E|nr:T9SS type A sorting domain-containing protein [Phaeodactylibacter xiamenensis]MCR9055489.1 T9SS type A sorting domain-containing protein [bacterium]